MFGGSNDSGQGIPVGDYQYSDWEEDDLLYFRPAFAYLLNRLQQTYPDAQIVNLINTGLKKDYKEAMETICQYYHVCNISLGDFEKIDGHPTKKEWNLSAGKLLRLWLNSKLWHKKTLLPKGNTPPRQ